MQLLDELDPGGNECRTVRGQVTIPDIESAQNVVVPAITCSRSGFQQGCALADDLVVVGPHAGDRRTAGRRKLVEVAPSFPRITADQRQILRAEQHCTQHAEDRRGTAYRRSVEPGLVCPSGRDLEIDGEFTPVV